VVEYGNIFWGNFSNIGHVFLLQKKVIRIIVHVGVCLGNLTF
jgi:hypothetical protein